MISLDHIAVAGTTLEEAAEAVESALGVVLQPGGRHERFGTHNQLLRLADGLYLEAIAIDPGAPPPDRPRWFDLDRFAGPPRLASWICKADDLDAALARLPSAGKPVDLARGDLRWRMAVPASGAAAFGGLHPALIEWQSPVHPSRLLASAGCSLRRLVVAGPDARALAAVLAPVFTDPRVAFEHADAPHLVAEIDTPHGPRVLE
jgi:hypothetical protein